MSLREFFKNLTPAQIKARDEKIKRDREAYSRRQAGMSAGEGHRIVEDALNNPEKTVAPFSNPIESDPVTPEQVAAISSAGTVLKPWAKVCDPMLAQLNRQEKRFTIKICPMGAPRMNRSVRWKPNKKHLRYFLFKDTIRAAVGQVQTPDELLVTAYLPMAKTWSKKRQQEMNGKPHRMKPDWDNIGKGCSDALFGEDCNIWSGSVKKFWCQQGEERIELTLVYYTKKSLA